MADEFDPSVEGNAEPDVGLEDAFSAIDTLGLPEEGSESKETQEQEIEKEIAQAEGGDALSEVETEKKPEVEKKEPEKDTTSSNGEKKYPDAIKTASARANFDALTKAKEEAVQKSKDAEIKAKTAEERAVQLETRIKELEAKSGVAAPEVSVLQKRVDELSAQLEEKEKILGFTAIEETKAFRESVTVPQDAALAEMGEIATTYELDTAALDKVLLEPNKYKRMEMLADITDKLPERASLVKSDLLGAVNKYMDSEKTRKELYDKAAGNRQFAEREKQEAEAKKNLERVESYRKAVPEVDEIWKKQVPEISGNEEVWKSVKAKADAIKDFDSMPPKAKVHANLASFAVPVLRDELRKERAAHEATKAILAKRNGVLPGAGGGRSALGGKGDNGDEKFSLDHLDEYLPGR